MLLLFSVAQGSRFLALTVHLCVSCGVESYPTSVTLNIM